jgi:hypothetical protein
LARSLQNWLHRRNGPAILTSGRIEMTHYASSLAAQVGAGFVAFIVSAACIAAAVGPVAFAG